MSSINFNDEDANGVPKYAISTIPVMKDPVFKRYKKILYMEEGQQSENAKLEDAYGRHDGLTKKHESPEEHHVKHPVLSSMDDPLEFNKQITMGQSHTLISPMLINWHGALQRTNEVATDKFSKNIIQLDALVQGGSTIERMARKPGRAVTHSLENSETVNTMATESRMYFETSFEEDVKEAMENSEICPSQYRFKSLKPWMFQVLQTHYYAFGPANEREIALLTKYLDQGNDLEIRRWFKEKSETVNRRGLEMKQKLIVDRFGKGAKRRQLKALNHH